MRTKLMLIVVLSTFAISLIATPYLGYTTTEAYGENVKIGFSWINGLVGATELTNIGYTKALEIGCQIEHREYRWDYLNLTLNQLYEWSEIYLKNYPQIESSLSMGVISGNTTALPITYNFTRYTSLTPGLLRFNDTAIVEDLKNMTDSIMEVIDLDYISFGSEINGFFETYYDYETKNLTNTVMLVDYVDLCEQMYDYVHAKYPSVKIFTVFRYQPTSDIKKIEAIVNSFNDTCDFFGLSTRVFTNDFGLLASLNQTEVIGRFSSFANITDKNFAITNAYTISDSRAGGSEYYQANFVRYLFDVIELYENRLEFVCWYTVFDYPPGYLGMIFSPYLEAHATAGLFTTNGDPKMSYYAWLEEMQAAGRLEDHKMPWKIGVSALAVAAIIGFVVFASVMEGWDFKKQLDKDAETIGMKPVESKPPKKKQKKSELIEFTTISFEDEDKTFEETEEE